MTTYSLVWKALYFKDLKREIKAIGEIALGKCGCADNRIMFHSKGSQALYLINKPTVIKNKWKEKTSGLKLWSYLQKNEKV